MSWLGTSVLREQIAKDKALIDNEDFKDVTWHFLVGAKSGKVGPTPEIIQALKDAGIPYDVHWA